MSRETYEYTAADGLGSFAPVDAPARFVFELPTQAHLTVKPSSEFAEWMAKDGIEFVVVQDPPTVQQIFEPVHDVRTSTTESFPPAGGHYIFEDRSTVPNNLRELIAARVAQGWTVSAELETLLAVEDNF